jgi:hypothetical protein
LVFFFSANFKAKKQSKIEKERKKNKKNLAPKKKNQIFRNQKQIESRHNAIRLFFPSKPTLQTPKTSKIKQKQAKTSKNYNAPNKLKHFRRPNLTLPTKKSKVENPKKSQNKNKKSESRGHLQR